MYSGVELFVKNFDFQLFLQNTIDSNCFIWSSLLVSKFLFKIKLFDTYSFIHSVNLIFALLATSLSVICNVDPSISAIYFAFLSLFLEIFWPFLIWLFMIRLLCNNFAFVWLITESSSIKYSLKYFSNRAIRLIFSISFDEKVIPSWKVMPGEEFVGVCEFF